MKKGDTEIDLDTFDAVIFEIDLETRDAKAFRSSLDFIRNLRKYEIPVAVVSSSRDCREVLDAAGALYLFDVILDGVDSDRLELAGIPAPDIFLEAARRLNARPDRVIVVEDALAGVEAARKGGFKCVVGVERTGWAREYEKHGADIVVEDLSELKLIDGSTSLCISSLADLPSALEHKEEILQILYRFSPAIFLDYDGTLTPIVENPAAAVLSGETREVIEKLGNYWTVAIISGRDLADVRKRVNIDHVFYAGSHGLDIAGPGNYRNQEEGLPFLRILDSAERDLNVALGDIPGCIVERKRFSVAVHYRMVEYYLLDELKAQVHRIASGYEELRMNEGKKVYDLRPDIEWDKGKALQEILKALYRDIQGVVPLYIGDDSTDEDVFRVIFDWGIGIAVGKNDRPTAAVYRLEDPFEVTRFLEVLLGRLKVNSRKGSGNGQA
jgi:alpha,alpha-trehalase